MKLAAVGLLAAVAGAPVATPAPAPAPARAVVIAELFTSEGCSSCPPADAFLQQLVSQQPLEGVEIIGIEEHVDYFDDLGWRDPFGSPLFTKRQSEYDERVFRSGDIFTPQLVINGAAQCIGSDRSAAHRAIVAAAQRPGATMRIEAGTVSGDHAAVTIDIDMPPSFGRHGAADVMIAIAEVGLASDVKRGENRGRLLSHGAVARAIVPAGTLSKNDRQFHATTSVPIGAGWSRPHLRVVAFLQERDSGRILGGAETALP